MDRPKPRIALVSGDIYTGYLKALFYRDLRGADTIKYMNLYYKFRPCAFFVQKMNLVTQT